MMGQACFCARSVLAIDFALVPVRRIWRWPPAFTHLYCYRSLSGLACNSVKCAAFPLKLEQAC